MEKRKMNPIDKRKRIRIIAFLLAVLLVVVVSWKIIESTADSANGKVVISLNSGFYDENQKIKLSIPKGMKVLYTDNCMEPNWENAVEYTKPISIVAQDEEQVYVYRFKVYDKENQEVDNIIRTYFVGKNVNNRYTTNILHLTGDPEDLFGYETGIFAKGKYFDEFDKLYPDVHYGEGVEANFTQRGAEWERTVYAEFFTADGEKILAQNCGIRIQGMKTRMKTQKSFRLYARKEYDVSNEFDFPFFADLVSEVDGTVAQEHKRLVLHNSGNDNGFAYIRTQLVGALANDAGFPDTLHATPVCVYINGQYYGFYWLQNSFDKGYFENRYGAYSGEFVVVEGSDDWKTDSDDAEVQPYVDEYNQMYQEYSQKDLTDDAVYQELCEKLDVENYLQYFAIENYVGNMDWPGNNVKAYRYVAVQDEELSEAPFDGKYRHLLFDTDYAFCLLAVNETLGVMPQMHTLDGLLGEKAPLFAALMKRQDCRDYFVNYTCDLMNSVMTVDYVNSVLSDMHAERYQELSKTIQDEFLMTEEFWNWENTPVSEESVLRSYGMIPWFAEHRPKGVLENFAKTYGWTEDDQYTLNVHKDGVSNVQINSLVWKDADFAGTYIGCVEVTVSPLIAPNEVFEGWLVNEQPVYEEQLTILSKDIVDGNVNVVLLTRTAEEVKLQINAIRAKGTQDFIEIRNLSDQSISTKGYYLSDDADWNKYPLPEIILGPQEVVRFYGKDCTDMEGLGEFSLNFNVKQQENIILSYKGELLETIQVPDLSKGGTYCRVGLGDEFEESLAEGE